LPEFALAGAILLAFRSPMVLFVADAVTFVLAAAVVLSIPNLGGGVRRLQSRGR